MVFLLVAQCVHYLILALWQTTQKAWSHRFPVVVFFFFFLPFLHFEGEIVYPSLQKLQKGVERPSVMKFVIHSSLWRHSFLFILSKPSLPQWNISLPVLWISPDTSWNVFRSFDLESNLRRQQWHCHVGLQRDRRMFSSRLTGCWGSCPLVSITNKFVMQSDDIVELLWEWYLFG